MSAAALVAKAKSSTGEAAARCGRGTAGSSQKRDAAGGDARLIKGLLAAISIGLTINPYRSLTFQAPGDTPACALPRQARTKGVLRHPSRFETLCREETVLSTEDVGFKSPIRRSPTRATKWQSRSRPLRRTADFLRARFSLVAALVDGCTITLCAVVVGVAYHGLVYHVGGVAGQFTGLGLLLAFLVVIFNTLRQEYELQTYLTFSGHMRRTLIVWNLAFLTALVFIFIMKESADYSRVAVLTFYAVGFLGLVATRALVVSRIKARAAAGTIVAVRAVLVGQEAELQAFTQRFLPSSFGLDVVASFVLRGSETLDDDIALAAASARVLRPDDIFILLPLAEADTIDACVAAFVKVPASIHLGPQRVLDRFSNVTVSRVGAFYSLNLVRRPLTGLEVITKRIFDLAVGLPLLLLLAPVFVAVALAIKLDSSGPVFFFQRRYGFNQETFRILKFRSMSVTEDDRTLQSVVRNDPRVTRIGRFMRRHNIDELPQLLNVIRGEMSLVGPRPHALVHNQQYEHAIGDYARRHNVKPGITGWAQVHGLRGEVTSEEMMRARLEHDLFYIDNWTIGLDIRILAMTLFSPKAFRNAY